MNSQDVLSSLIIESPKTSIRLYNYADDDLLVDYKHDAPGDHYPHPMHIHNTYELSYTLSGEGQCFVEGTQYPLFPGTLCLFRPITVHIGNTIPTVVHDRVLM